MVYLSPCLQVPSIILISTDEFLALSNFLCLASVVCDSKAETPIIDTSIFLLQIKQHAAEGWLVLTTHFEYLSLHNHSSWKVDSECVLFLLVIYNLDEKQKFMHKAHKANPVDTGHKLNVHPMFRRRPGHLLNVWYMFNLCPMSTGKELF